MGHNNEASSRRGYLGFECYCSTRAAGDHPRLIKTRVLCNCHAQHKQGGSCGRREAALPKIKRSRDIEAAGYTSVSALAKTQRQGCGVARVQKWEITQSRPRLPGRCLRQMNCNNRIPWAFKMTKTVSALYDTYDAASSAVSALESAGVAHSDISIVANNSEFGTTGAMLPTLRRTQLTAPGSVRQWAALAAS